MAKRGAEGEGEEMVPRERPNSELRIGRVSRREMSLVYNSAAATTTP